MRILAVETSCDDTCVAIIEIKNSPVATGSRKMQEKFKIKSFEILANIVSSQIKIHAKYGGVYPTIAVREHEKNLPTVLYKALKQSKLSKIFNETSNPKSKIKNLGIDAIAVTVGPGLDPCLWAGINFAKKLAMEWNIPLVPVNHIEGHILVNWLSPISSKLRIQNYKLQIFPAICLIVSGGHTQIILMEKIGKYKIIGETRDDAAGECFDKTARIIGLPYPGGPAIAKIASQRKSEIRNPKFEITLPRPMIYQKNYDFSFSGLKTAVLYEWQKRNTPPRRGPARGREKYIQAFCFEIQQAIIDTLIHKTLKAAKDFGVKTMILGGGVSANKELRKQFKVQSSHAATRSRKTREKSKVKLFVPEKKFSMDNAVMIAVAGFFNQKKATKNYEKIKSIPNLQINS